MGTKTDLVAFIFYKSIDTALLEYIKTNENLIV